MRLAAAVLLVMTPAWSSAAPQSSTVTLTATQDTYVDGNFASTSYGSAAYLSADNNAGAMERFYVKFDTSSLAGQTISSASLKLWCIRENSGGSATDIFELYPIYSPWTDALTYSSSSVLSQGAMAASVPSTNYGDVSNTVTPPQPVTFDITTLMASWASGGANEGVMIMISNSGNADYRFATLEDSSPSLRPSLTVTSSGAPPPPPPPPPPGPGPAPAPPPSGGSGSEGDEGLCGALGIEAVIFAGLLGLLRRRKMTE